MSKPVVPVSVSYLNLVFMIVSSDHVFFLPYGVPCSFFVESWVCYPGQWIGNKDL